jgi:hypothetical protein
MDHLTGHIAVVDIFPVVEEDTVPVADILVEDSLEEDSLEGGTLVEDNLKKEMYNQSGPGFQRDIIYGPSNIHLNTKLAINKMEKESQNWSPCAKGNNTLLKSH